jgi:hypothetical protein
MIGIEVSTVVNFPGLPTRGSWKQRKETGNYTFNVPIKGDGKKV